MQFVELKVQFSGCGDIVGRKEKGKATLVGDHDGSLCMSTLAAHWHIIVDICAPLVRLI